MLGSPVHCGPADVMGGCAMREDFFAELSDAEVSMVGADGTAYSCSPEC